MKIINAKSKCSKSVNVLIVIGQSIGRTSGSSLLEASSFATDDDASELVTIVVGTSLIFVVS